MTDDDVLELFDELAKDIPEDKKILIFQLMAHVALKKVCLTKGPVFLCHFNTRIMFNILDKDTTEKPDER